MNSDVGDSHLPELFLGPVDDSVTTDTKSQSHTEPTTHPSESCPACIVGVVRGIESSETFSVYWLFLCHTSSVRNTSDSGGPVTRKSSG